MKNRIYLVSLAAAVAGLILVFVSSATAQPTTALAPTAAPAAAAPVRLPYGVEDVLKLSHAQVSEDIILNYVQNSGIIYDLRPNDLVFLHNQGVSDHVVSAMLDQRNRLTYQQTQAAAQQAAAVAASTAQAQYSSAASTPAYAPNYVQASAPQPAPSSVYVIPYAPAQAAYYGSYSYPSYFNYPYYYGTPYYGGYYGGYYGPTISFGFHLGGSSVAHFHVGGGGGGGRHR
jgi:hypothetical protein